jgi:undecaprenyl pyrophosphate phosphatase UppP
MSEEVVAGVGAAIALASIHLLGGRLAFLDRIPRSRWLSAAGGVSVAYVFVHLLPELAQGQRAVEESAIAAELLPLLENHVYLLALVGLLVFYGVERHSVSARRRQREVTGEDRTTDAAFRLSIASFAVYNAMIGYLLVRGELDTVGALALYAFALGLHFVINDSSLREHHKAYRDVGRWVLSAAVLIGLALGLVTEIPERAIALVLAFIAGGVVLNVLKEEVPSDNQARFAPFVLAAGLYAALLQAL